MSADAKPEMLHRLLVTQGGRCLVFSRTKRGVDRIARALARKGINVAVIHGDRSQSQRTAALAGFQQGRFDVLVATDVASRGIHVEQITHVINYDLPEIAENFIHRVGRTGRAGELGIASTLFSRDQRTELFQLERTLGIRIERVSANGRPAQKTERTSERAPTHTQHVSASADSRMVRLPGEILQAQMDGLNSDSSFAG